MDKKKAICEYLRKNHMPIQKPVGWKRYVTIFLHRKATLFPVWKQELRFVQSRGKQ